MTFSTSKSAAKSVSAELTVEVALMPPPCVSVANVVAPVAFNVLENVAAPLNVDAPLWVKSPELVIPSAVLNPPLY